MQSRWRPREGGRQGGREAGRGVSVGDEEGREEGREGGREGGKEGMKTHLFSILQVFAGVGFGRPSFGHGAWRCEAKEGAEDRIEKESERER